MRRYFKGLITLLFIVQWQMLYGQALSIYTADEPPLSFHENGVVTGFSTDIVNDIVARTQGKEFVQMVPWSRAYKTSLLTPNSVVFTMARTPLRETLFHWVGPIVKKRWVLYSLKNRGFEIADLADVASLTIGVVRDDARANFLKSSGLKNIYEVDDHHIALNMLMKGRVDLWAASDFEGPMLIKDSGFNVKELESVFVIKTIESYIGISLGTDQNVVKAWQAAFQELKKDKVLNQIAHKWRGLTELKMTGQYGVIEILPN